MKLTTLLLAVSSGVSPGRGATMGPASGGPGQSQSAVTQAMTRLDEPLVFFLMLPSILFMLRPFIDFMVPIGDATRPECGDGGRIAVGRGDARRDTATGTAGRAIARCTGPRDPERRKGESRRK